MKTAAAFQETGAVPSEGAAALPVIKASMRFLSAFVSPRSAALQSVAKVVSSGAARFRSAHTFRPERQVVSSSEWFSLSVLPSSCVRGLPAFGAASSASASPSNNSLEPTPVTNARFLGVSSGAAQLSRWAG